jgi:DNA-binding PadR family transcriptional regulator
MYRQAIYQTDMKPDVDREMLHGHLELLVLAVLAGGPLHVYALRGMLDERSRHRLRAGFGRLYPLMRHLQHRGFVEGRWAPAGPVRRKRVYRLTPRGRDRLRFLSLAWDRFSAGVDAVMRHRTD